MEIDLASAGGDRAIDQTQIHPGMCCAIQRCLVVVCARQAASMMSPVVSMNVGGEAPAVLALPRWYRNLRSSCPSFVGSAAQLSSLSPLR